MITTPLTRDLIKNTEHRYLTLSFSNSVLEVLITGDDPGEEPLVARIPFTVTSTVAAALEEAVYSNPLLLSQFKRTTVIAVTPRFHVLPSESSGDQDLADALAEMFDHDNPAYIFDDIDRRHCVAAAVDREVFRFVQRTFDRATLRSHIAVLGSFFATRSRLGNTAKMFVNLRHGRDMEIVVYNNHGLDAATYISCSDLNDTIYYILAAATAAHIDLGAGDEVFLGGDKDRRAAVLPALQKYAPKVLPLIIPSTAPLSARDLELEMIVNTPKS